jgi:hypothetical protein
MAVGMRDAHPWHGHTAGRMNRTGHAVPENGGGVARARPDVDQAVSRCVGSGVGAGVPRCIRRYLDTEPEARIQTPGRADVGQMAGAERLPLVEGVCQCNLGDPSGIARNVDGDARPRAMK